MKLECCRGCHPLDDCPYIWNDELDLCDAAREEMELNKYAALEARIRAQFDKWLPRLWGSWVVDVRYYNGPVPDEVISEADKQAGNVVAANCHAKWEYGMATVKVSVPGFEGMTDDQIEYTVVHELMHIMVNETRQTEDDWLKHEERVATMLAHMMIEVSRGEKSDVVI